MILEVLHLKRIFSVFLSLALAVSLFPAALAEESAGMDRGALAQRLAELCGYADELEGYAAQPSAFSDVAEEDECRAAVNLLRDKGLMQGDGSGAFRPSVPATRADAVTVLLRWAGLTEAQIGAYGSYDSACLMASLGLSGDLAGGIKDEGELTDLYETVKPLYDALHAEVPAPYFVDGAALPIFPYDTVIREVVYVETDVDTDGDGKADKVQVLVQRPAATDRGMKAASIFEARPYSAGCTDAYDLDTWNAHIVDARLTEATASTSTGKEDWDWHASSEPGPATLEVQTAGGAGAAGDGGDVWSNTENVDAYDYWLVRGYAYVSCSGLGTLGSDGFETCASADETAAFASVVRWLAGDEGVKAYSDKNSGVEVKADWSNGNVAMSGQSYAGSTAFAVASTGVEGLKTIVPRAGIASWYDYYRSQGIAAGGLYYPGDDCNILADYCMSRQLDETDYASIQADYEAYLEEMIAEQDALSGDYNRFWDERNYTNGAENLKCSALIIHGLNDFNVRPKQFDLMYDAFRTAKQEVKLLLHQGAHYTPEQIEGLDLNGILGRWYAHYLYGVDNGAEREAEVRVQSNTDLSWNIYDAWGDAVESIVPSAGEGESRFTSDLGVTSFDTSLADVEEGWIEYCSDMDYTWEQEMIAGATGASAVYTFDIEKDMHISGTPTVTVRASADRPTGILSAMLVDLAPEGGMEAVMLEQYGEGVATETVEANGLWYGGGLAAKDLTQFSMTSTDNKIVTRGWMDIQNRTSIYRVDMVEPGMFYAFTLELQPMDYTVKAGHKLALVLYSVDPEVTYWPEAVTNFTVDNTGTYVTIPVR